MGSIREQLALAHEEAEASEIQEQPEDSATSNSVTSASDLRGGEPSEKGPRRVWEVRMDIENGPVTIPAVCVSEANTSPSEKEVHSKPGDLVSERIVSAAEAENLFQLYSLRLDHYLYRILGEPTTLATIRSRSPVLLASICAVASLHSTDLGHLFDKCYERLYCWHHDYLWQRLRIWTISGASVLVPSGYMTWPGILPLSVRLAPGTYPSA